MIEHFLAEQSAPFAVAIGLMLLLAAVEGVGLLFGIAVSGLIDTLLPDLDVPDVDIDMDMDMDVDMDIDLDVDADMDVSVHAPDLDAPSGVDAPGYGLMTQLLGWLSFGRVPALVLLIAFLTSFGLVGLLVQGFVFNLTGGYVSPWLAVVPALAVALPATRYIGIGLGRIMPKVETDAVSSATFIGRIATIVRGEAAVGMPAEAKVIDQHDLTHYVLVEPDTVDDGTEEKFTAGTEVLLVRQSGSRFFAIRNTHSVLSRR